ncbi:MAG: Rrf2 family transcriptional regulator [Actinobacteria bacterium]|nr:Rrf2 family transcriptional regulator [Actinomycetota bacterium]
MRISARADYAVRAAIELAAAPPGTPVKAETIARNQDIPREFLENILRDLRRRGLVRSQRGAEGGSMLARPAADIRVAEVLRAVEGPLAAVRGVRPDSLKYTGPAESLVDVWIALRASLRSVLDEVTLADIATGALPAVVRKAAADPANWQPR